MAGEAFAGESITQKPGKRPDRGGIYLSLTDIPNAPAPPQMGLAQYGKVPAIRMEYQQPVSGFEQRAEMLQQKPLPPGIKEGLDRAANVAGTGQAAMAEAITSVGQKISKAMANVSDAVAAYAHQANKIHEDTIEKRTVSNWKEEITRQNAYADSQLMTPQQRQEYFDKEVWPKMEASIDGASRMDYTRDSLRSTLGALRESQITKTQVDQSAITIDAAKFDMLNVYNRQVRDHDWAGARDSLKTMELNNFISPEKAAVDTAALDEAEVRDHWYQLPREIREKEALAASQGTESKEFRFLNEPGNAEKEYKFAKEQQTINDENWSSKMLQQIWDNNNGPNKGLNPVTDEQLVHDGKVNGITPRIIDLVRQANAKPDIPLDPGKLATGTWMVAQYDPKKDVGEMGAPNPNELYRLSDWAIKNLPQKEAAEMITAAKKKLADHLEGKDPDPQQKFYEDAVKRLNTLKENGGLMTPEGETIPFGVEKEAGEPKTFDLEQMRKADMAFVLAHDRVREWMKKNPEATEADWAQAFPTFVKPYTDEAAKKGGIKQTLKEAYDWWEKKWKDRPRDVDFSRQPGPGMNYQIPQPLKPNPAPIPVPPQLDFRQKQQSYAPTIAPNRQIAAMRAPYIQQIQRMFPLIAAVLSREDGSPEGATAVLEALVNRTPRETGSVYRQIFNGFYGPINDGQVARVMREGIPNWAIRNAQIAIANVSAGSNITQGATDQGMYGEIKGRIRRKIGHNYYGYFPKDPEFEA